MQMKHLIIFALVGMVALLGFNLINGNQREKNREVIVSNATSEQSPSKAITETDKVANSSTDIASQPLGKQPKAILDSATTQIEQAQQADQQRLDQMGSAE
ncbi:hypothetical protein ACT3TI_09205 [Psychrobacter sp. AOP22-C1-22]|uniref:hypothetical protein n=1 Tax=unclassified Psychrobacter TaxID=196806 RepID=UPI0017877E37|nr:MULTISPECIES: hypothetical protein [unclassified Psychrobacter]MDN5801256.1 hypothetical protein [Psychrobacter sp.]MBE0406959.1 hypothetical protein [Psychrobacter sp. FME6]MBE0444874.1 hypothetical protein [Psychrobacter sp. FME5]MDN5891139.1 hypothetical protein [Psychrobacter sp.]MDN5897230.1 hypothetical protein [Psychrobacter sp.]